MMFILPFLKILISIPELNKRIFSFFVFYSLLLEKNKFQMITPL